MIVLMQDNQICLQRLLKRLPAMLEEHTSMVMTFAWWSRILKWLPLTCQKTRLRGQHGPKKGSARKKLTSMSNGQLISKRIFALYTPLCGGDVQTLCKKGYVDAMDTFGQMSTTGDGLMLLRANKDITYNFQSQKYLLHLLYESKRRFYMLFQGRTTTTQAYLEQFQSMIDVIQRSGGSIGEDSGVEKMILGEKSKDNFIRSRAD